MTSYEKIKESINITNSILCVGLDTDIAKLPTGVAKDTNGMIEFNQRIIEATKKYTSAYKINFAFYEQYGIDGFTAMKKTIESIPGNKFIIADAKRGDIGNTSAAYAKSCFDYFDCDAVTVNPYMGFDSVKPFLDYRDKFIFLLALTSNRSSADFQYIESAGKPVYLHVVEKSKIWDSSQNLGYVFGATHVSELARIRDIIPEHFLLIPGVGAQGADVDAILKANRNCPAIINVSRDIIYSSAFSDYDEKAAEKAEFYMNLFNSNT